MGTRLHTHTTHKIEYGTGLFNCKLHMLAEWFDDEDIEYHCKWDECGCCADFEIELPELEKAIDIAKQSGKGELFDDYTGDDVADDLTIMLEEADTGSGYAHATYF